MATAASTHAHAAIPTTQPIKNGLYLVWLDDSADEDPNAKDILLSIYEHVYAFKDVGKCLELIEAAVSEEPCLSVLTSGKYGHMIAHDRLQPLHQIKYIYVYCFDIAKHSQWAEKCNKVRCVESDFGKILQRMQNDAQKNTKHKHKTDNNDQEQEQVQEHEHEEEEEPVSQQSVRFMDDSNFYDQLALDLLLQIPDDNGAEDFKKHCETHTATDQEGHAHEEQQYFKPNVPIKEWYKKDLFFVNLNATDFTQLWTLRWFIRLFHRQLTHEQEDFIKDGAKFTCYYGTWLDTDELDAMKHRIGQIIICSEFFMTYASKDKALNVAEHEKNEQKQYRIVFEINIDKNTRYTVPYSNIDDDVVLIWFGSRHRIIKIEYIEDKNKPEESYWLIGLNLCSTFDAQQSFEALYTYYRKNLLELNDIHRALGRILMYKGLYWEAEKWLLTNNHYGELAELAIRQNQCERANQYLQHLPEDCNDTNLLRAYVDLLSSSDNVAKARTSLLKISIDATDRIVRARVNIALGFISLIATQQIDEALVYFTIGSDTLKKYLPDIHPDIARSYIGIGYAYFSLRNIKDAEKYFQMALHIQQQLLPYLHPDLAKVRNGLAHCLSVQKQTSKQALQELEHAFNILMYAFPHEHKKHPEILLTKSDIDKIRKGKELRARNTLLDYI